MKQTKILCLILSSFWVLFGIYYYNVFDLVRLIPRPIRYDDNIPEKRDEQEGHIKAGSENERWPVAVIQQNYTKIKNEENLLLNTPGCVIPNVQLKFKIPKFKMKPSCGKRAVNVIKTENNHVKFLIDVNIMNVYSKGSQYSCCYQYVTRSTISGREDTKISYSTCFPFENGTETILKHEIINVMCDSKEKKQKIYDDSYALIVKSRNIITKFNKNQRKWNVLVIGMDTMSRYRVQATMPLTVEYFRRHGWLDFRGYHKVGLNTFPNLMSMLTGKNMSTIYEKCAKGMTYCNDLLIWSRFEEAGYATAYGEDYLSLPDTFNRYQGFARPPTHHYLRPFFLTGEHQQGPLLCTKKLPSAINVLNYAVDFAQTYANDSFFGFFWSNSYSHNYGHSPTLLDEDIVNFFKKLTSLGVMTNTIVVFASDHGIRYGVMRLPVESYYEERLPMFFMWMPSELRDSDAESYTNGVQNQFRLTTPYDFYMTFWDILKRGNSQLTVPVSEACPRCDSLFSPISKDRNCADAMVSKQWCSCHTLTKVSEHEDGARQSIALAVSFVQNKTKLIKTKKCTKCSDFTLSKVGRVHHYTEQNKVYYVIAFFLSPGNVGFEATIEKDSEKYEVQGSIETISSYNTRGSCVVHSSVRAFCVCLKTQCR